MFISALILILGDLLGQWVMAVGAMPLSQKVVGKKITQQGLVWVRGTVDFCFERLGNPMYTSLMREERGIEMYFSLSYIYAIIYLFHGLTC